MTGWIAPQGTDLETVIAASEGRLILCSPYISTPALNIVSDGLPDSVSSIEVWTRLETKDWLTGASDPEGLLDFMREVEGRIDTIALRHARHLHAKVFISDGPMALAGSANLTAGGFRRNLEVARVVMDDEIGELRAIVDRIRPNLSPVDMEQFESYVSNCVEKLDSQEALLDLIRQEMPAPDLGPRALVPFNEFLKFVSAQRSASNLAEEVHRIARNLDGNNNSGKVKQAFFGVQRFLQEYPQHQSFVRALPEEDWFDVGASTLRTDWVRFLNDFRDEVNQAYQYSMPTLIRYLTPSSGGTRRGGGGGDNELKRVWPLVPRAIAAAA